MTFQEEDIGLFNNPSKRGDNDNANKRREDILTYILNISLKSDPPLGYEFININPEWINLYEELHKYAISNLPSTIGDIKSNIISYKCIKKAGRSNRYDFSLIYELNNGGNHVRDIEFKYNSEKVEDCAQFHSPSDPEKHLISEIPFTKYHYDNYLPIFSSYLDMDLPHYDIYKKEMKFKNSPDFPLLSVAKKKYYSGSTGSSQYTGLQEDITFYELSNEISKECFKNFFEICELDHESLTDLWLSSQINKEYMLYKDGKLHYQKLKEDDYKIISVEKKCPNFICKTQSGRVLKVLFRWRNGAGIANPAFQVSMK
jgi:hypothetical protein